MRFPVNSNLDSENSERPVVLVSGSYLAAVSPIPFSGTAVYVVGGQSVYESFWNGSQVKEK